MRTQISKTMTLGQLAQASGLARASLLHYESLGLLLPARRSAAGYRLYGEAELERLRSIRRFREAGLSLQAIQELLLPLKPPGSRAAAGPGALLEARLLDLCQEVQRLRNQQQQLARLLAAPEFRGDQPFTGKAAWVALLNRAGFDEEDMRQWHASFEADSAVEHEAFLFSLGLASDEVAAIRSWSKTWQGASSS